MDWEQQDSRTGDDPKWESVDFRHLSAFQKVYQDRSYVNAGQGVFATRKSVVRMMQNLERSFDCVLFNEGLRGELHPTPFADRLFNDLRFLNAARHRMKDHVAAIHEDGRVLNVGCSAAVFRTREFRNLFRELQSLGGIRACYSPIDSADAGKALVSGHCDFYIGCWTGSGSRFVTQNAGAVPFRPYQRVGSESARVPLGQMGGEYYLVSLDGQVPDAGAVSDAGGGAKILTDSQWLYWLDHPEKCPEGTVVIGPEVEIDKDRWCLGEDELSVVGRQPLHASFLRQHPYEFMPKLMEKIQTRAAF
ncbi:MAG: LysR family transcriptional regulator [Luteolibacter sp.]